MTVTPNPKGGVTFFLQPTGNGSEYNFWIYVCPLDIPFSGKTAKARILQNVTNGIVPWGTVTLTKDANVMDLLLAEVHNPTRLPTTIHPLIGKIQYIIKNEQRKWEEAVSLRQRQSEQLALGIEPNGLLCGNPYPYEIY